MPLPKKLPFQAKIILLSIFAVTVLLLLFPAIKQESLINVERADLIADYKQTDPIFGFPDKGKDFCAPVAALDSFCYLEEQRSYKQIFPAQKGKDSRFWKANACRLLAMQMRCSNGPGTSTEDFLAGLKAYIKKNTPYLIEALKYRGWNRHQPEFDDGHSIPDLDWIKSGISDNRSCWINIGWYELDPVKNEYKRTGGHWLTLVGYGLGFDGLSNADTLIVRDPDPVLSKEPRKIFITVSPLKDGTLSGAHDGLPRSAKSYLKIESMGNGLDSSRGRTGIIDGAICLDLWPPFLSDFSKPDK